MYVHDIRVTDWQDPVPSHLGVKLPATPAPVEPSTTKNSSSSRLEKLALNSGTTGGARKCVRAAAGRSAADPSIFDREVGGWLPRLGEFDFPPLLGSDLYYVFQHKRVSAGGLDGWGWKELKAFPVAWFDWLAVVLSRVELDGVWPDGL